MVTKVHVVNAHHDWLAELGNQHWASSLFSDAFELLHRYQMPQFNAYTARLPQSILRVLLVPPG